MNKLTELKEKLLNMKEHRYILFIFLFLLVLFFGHTFSRYVNKIYDNHFLESKHFYFTSDKLSDSLVNYRINNWSGADAFPINIELNSKKNELEFSSVDITYDVRYVCDSNVICSLSKTSGTIYSSTHSDSFSLTVTPVTPFATGDTTIVDIYANATSPYTKEISARFIITAGQEGVNYEIVDEVNRPYFNLDISNTVSTYKIAEAFGSYSVNDEISYDTYQSLSAENKAKCVSKIIELSFDPSVVLLDTTNEIVANAISTGTTTIGGYDYINNISFKVDAVSSYEIRFYKKNKSLDYTYPIVNQSSIVTVGVR